MAKFRQHHTKAGNQGISFIVRVVLYGLALLFLVWSLLKYFKKQAVQQGVNSTVQAPMETPAPSFNGTIKNTEISNPSQSGSNSLIKHQFYTLSYAEQHEQAEWVAYTMTRDQLNSPKQDRFNYFAPDLAIKTQSALHRDYTGSGYSRGHLAPAADMAFDPMAAEECFFMSNISPQLAAFNRGIWRELEENVRDWARVNNQLFIVTGPVLKTGIKKQIGDNRVSVPSLFYKVLLDNADPVHKGIGFIIPNAISELPLENYVVTIDSVEQMTGIDFFNANGNDSVIESLERDVNKQDWKFNGARYKKRVEEWNKKE